MDFVNSYYTAVEDVSSTASESCDVGGLFRWPIPLSVDETFRIGCVVGRDEDEQLLWGLDDFNSYLMIAQKLSSNLQQFYQKRGSFPGPKLCPLLGGGWGHSRFPPRDSSVIVCRGVSI